LTVANSLWLQTSSSPVKEEFVDLLKGSYGCEVFELKRNGNATLEINDWVKNATKGEIEKIVGKEKIISAAVKKHPILSFAP